jgi:hypothetical protein
MMVCTYVHCYVLPPCTPPCTNTYTCCKKQPSISSSTGGSRRAARGPSNQRRCPRQSGMCKTPGEGTGPGSSGPSCSPLHSQHPVYTHVLLCHNNKQIQQTCTSHKVKHKGPFCFVLSLLDGRNDLSFFAKM